MNLRIQRLNVRALSAALLALFLAAGVATKATAQQDDLTAVQRMLDSGRSWDALKQLDKIISKQPGNREARFMRGIVLVQLDRNVDAIAVFEKLTTEFPQLPEPYNNLAVLYAQEGQYDKAKQALLAAIATHPSYATAHENLGDIYATLARQAYNRALELDTANEAARVKLAMLDRIVAPPASGNGAPPVARTERVASNGAGNRASNGNASSKSRSAARPVSSAANNRVKADVLAAVETWRQAWSAQDVNEYIVQYGPDFVPPRDMSRSAWERERRSRLRKPNRITVKVDNASVNLVNDRIAEVTFRQLYRSEKYSDRVRKRLTMHKLNGEWRIAAETVI